MSETSRIRFIPEINLGHIASASVFLVTAGIVYGTVNARITRLEDQVKDSKENVVGVETRMLSRINEERARLDGTQAGVAYDIREIKQIMRDGFKDLDMKLERKQDKPGR